MCGGTAWDVVAVVEDCENEEVTSFRTLPSLTSFQSSSRGLMGFPLVVGVLTRDGDNRHCGLTVRLRGLTAFESVSSSRGTAVSVGEKLVPQVDKECELAAIRQLTRTRPHLLFRCEI